MEVVLLNVGHLLNVIFVPLGATGLAAGGLDSDLKYGASSGARLVVSSVYGSIAVMSLVALILQREALESVAFTLFPFQLLYKARAGHGIVA